MSTKSPPAGEHLAFIDILRGIAILAVFSFHTLGATYGADGDKLPWNGWVRSFDLPWSQLVVMPLYFGWAGVTLFFVISGFCIHLSHARSKDKGLDVFFLRRFFRIYPPFLVACLIFAAIRLNFHSQFWASLTDLMTHLFLLNNYLPGPGGINGSFWSIAVEVQLYLLYPFLLAIAGSLGWRRAMWITAAVQLSIMIANLLASNFYTGMSILPGFSRSPLGAWYVWAIGAALADAYLKGEPLPFRKIPFYLWFAMGVVSYFYLPVFDFMNLGFALASASLIALGLERPELFSSARFGGILKPLATVGLVSYSGYLIHQPILKILLLIALKLAHHPLPAWVVLLLGFSTFAVIFPVAYGFYRFIELPSIDLGKWIIQKRRRAGAPVPASAPTPVATVKDPPSKATLT